MPSRASRSRSTGASTARRNRRNRRPARRATRPEDYAEASERLVSRIAQQAAPRVATLIGKPPTFQPRSPGQVAAGVSVPLEPPPDAAPAMASANVPRLGADAACAARSAGQGAGGEPVTGAPSDGNRQLYSGMRRALGSSKIVIVDAAGADVFTVVGTVSLTPIDERAASSSSSGCSRIRPARRSATSSRPIRCRLPPPSGSWAGFGDIVATAASEGVLELLEKAINRPR